MDPSKRYYLRPATCNHVFLWVHAVLPINTLNLVYIIHAELTPQTILVMINMIRTVAFYYASILFLLYQHYISCRTVIKPHFSVDSLRYIFFPHYYRKLLYTAITYTLLLTKNVIINFHDSRCQSLTETEMLMIEKVSVVKWLYWRRVVTWSTRQKKEKVPSQ